MPTYILQKDTPLSNAGEEFNYLEKYGVYVSSVCSDSIYSKVIVENKPEWFIKKEENINVEIHEIYPNNNGEFHLYEMRVYSKKINFSKIIIIEQEIKRILQDE